MAKKMTKAQVTALIEQTMRQQMAQDGRVSARLLESYVAIRKWRKPKRATIVHPAPPQTEEAPQLVDLIAAAKAEEPSPPSPQPARGPAIQPHTPVPSDPPPAAPPQAAPQPSSISASVLAAIENIALEETRPSQHQPVIPPPDVMPPRPTPQPQVYFASHLLNEDTEPERPAGYSDTYF